MTLRSAGSRAGRATATAATSASNSARWSGSLIIRRKARVVVAALRVPAGLVVGVHLALAAGGRGTRRWCRWASSRGDGGLLDHGAVLADVGDEAFHLQGDGAGFVVAVGDVGLGALAGVELVEFNVAGGDFGFDVLADAGGVIIDAKGRPA